MAVIKCKMCGGDLRMKPGSTLAHCEYCGTKQTVPSADNEKKMNLFARASRLRFTCEFDKAAALYENILAEFPNEAEAYWGLVLCRYGIEYVDDPSTGKRIPTCHRASYDSILDDEDYEQACRKADIVARRVYRQEAKTIEEIRKGIVSVSSSEDPYDIFICYKETDEDGERTMDSVLAQDVYDELTGRGYKVFFSRVTLEDKLGTEYEPYIFSALSSAKLMLVFGTSYDNFTAVWVRNEWSRFLSLMSSGQKKTLIPCYRDLDPSEDMPKEFRKLQSQNLGKVGAVQDLLRGIDKIMGKHDRPQPQPQFQSQPQFQPQRQPTAEETAQAQSKAQENALLRRARIFLEDGKWEKAEQYYDRTLDINPESAAAYVGKMLIWAKVFNLEQLQEMDLESPGPTTFIPYPAREDGWSEWRTTALTDFPDYGKILRFGDEQLRKEIELTNLLILSRNAATALRYAEEAVSRAEQAEQEYLKKEEDKSFSYEVKREATLGVAKELTIAVNHYSYAAALYEGIPDDEEAVVYRSHCRSCAENISESLKAYNTLSEELLFCSWYEKGVQSRTGAEAAEEQMRLLISSKDGSNEEQAENIGKESVNGYQKAAEMFDQAQDLSDALDQAAQCRNKAEEVQDFLTEYINRTEYVKDLAKAQAAMEEADKSERMFRLRLAISSRSKFSELCSLKKDVQRQYEKAAYLFDVSTWFINDKSAKKQVEKCHKKSQAVEKEFDKWMKKHR